MRISTTRLCLESPSGNACLRRIRSAGACVRPQPRAAAGCLVLRGAVTARSSDPSQNCDLCVLTRASSKCEGSDMGRAVQKSVRDSAEVRERGIGGGQHHHRLSMHLCSSHAAITGTSPCLCLALRMWGRRRRLCSVETAAARAAGAGAAQRRGEERKSLQHRRVRAGQSPTAVIAHGLLPQRL